MKQWNWAVGVAGLLVVACGAEGKDGSGSPESCGDAAKAGATKCTEVPEDQCDSTERWYDTREACENDGRECRNQGTGACGAELGCCEQAECDDGRARFVSPEACERDASNCTKVEACCTTIWCGNTEVAPGDPGLGVVRSEPEVAKISFAHTEGFFAMTCSGAVTALRRQDGELLPLRDERPRSTNGPHYLDGEFHLEVFENEGCDVVSCEPLQEQSISLVEFREVGTRAAPEGVFETERLVPDIESAPAVDSLHVRVRYYTDEDCAGEAQEVSVDLAGL
jgi:hypothetical protein